MADILVMSSDVTDVMNLNIRLFDPMKINLWRENCHMHYLLCLLWFFQDFQQKKKC